MDFYEEFVEFAKTIGEGFCPKVSDGLTIHAIDCGTVNDNSCNECKERKEATNYEYQQELAKAKAWKKREEEENLIAEYRAAHEK